MQSSDQWTFLPAHLQSTPTLLLDNQTPHHELLRRVSGIEFLFRVGLQLKLYVSESLAAWGSRSAPNRVERLVL